MDEAVGIPAGRRSAVRRRIDRKKLTALLFVAPALLLHIGVVAGPSLFTFVLSLFKWNGIGRMTYIGLGNFRQMFTDDRIFRIAVSNNVKWTIMFLTVPVALGLGAAVLIGNVKRGGMIYRTLYYLPATIATVVVARMWLWIYNPFIGINTLLQSLGLNFLALDWLSDRNLALYAVAIADNWHWWGFLCIMFLAALTQIDNTLYEAARVDGANAWQAFWHVTVPSIRPTIVFVMLMTTLWSFLVFDLVFLITRSGPGNATTTLATWIYFQAVSNLSSGYASALATMTTLMLSLVIAGYVWVRMKGWEV